MSFSIGIPNPRETVQNVKTLRGKGHRYQHINIVTKELSFPIGIPNPRETFQNVTTLRGKGHRYQHIDIDAKEPCPFQLEYQTLETPSKMCQHYVTYVG